MEDLLVETSTLLPKLCLFPPYRLLGLSKLIDSLMGEKVCPVGLGESETLGNTFRSFLIN